MAAVDQSQIQVEQYRKLLELSADTIDSLLSSHDRPENEPFDITQTTIEAIVNCAKEDLTEIKSALNRQPLFAAA